MCLIHYCICGIGLWCRDKLPIACNTTRVLPIKMHFVFWKDPYTEKDTEKEYKKNNESPPTSYCAFDLLRKPSATLRWFISHSSKSQKSSNRLPLLVSCLWCIEKHENPYDQSEEISKWIRILRNPRRNKGSHSCLKVRPSLYWTVFITLKMHMYMIIH
jgi:hypothetical protein